MALSEKNPMVAAHILVWMVLVLLSSRITLIDATATDIECLKSIKDSLVDPYNYLNTTWDFNNNTEGFLCRFMGVECWHPDENRVLNIRLSDLSLKGQFPLGIQKCTSLTGLDLSRNKLFGSIPANISKLLPYVTNLDLSFNNFSGGIPLNLANCSFLNDLKLDNNRLTGNIAPEFGLLDRIKIFSVTNNLLSGPIPTFFHGNISVDSYANNLDLCGKLLKLCPGVQRKSHVGVIAAAAAGGITFTSIICGIFLYYLSRGVAKRKADDPEGNRWAKSIKGTKGIKVSMFEKSVSKMRLCDLMKATNDFSNNNIIGAGRTGPLYKAVLSEDGPLLHTAIDKHLPGNGYDHELNQFLKVACNCVVENAKERPTMFEVHQLLRAIGERYHFTTDDDIMLPSDTGDTAFPDELIVATEVTKGVE
uniref:Leucine-rich repeat-containing N-terminal plant-type domain-containing protein n=1 Tax=Populus alba TaxID=43335 RepID=A0A4U5QF76_POPAL|nr:hypothetical protein D5086_0000110830 [Populus alba]